MKQLIRSIKAHCVHHYESIAVAENITSGCLQMLLGSVEQAGEYFHGGLTVCNNDQLRQQLDLTSGVPTNKNAAGLVFTIEMARKVALKFNSEIGIAIYGNMTSPEGLYEPAYAAIVRFNKIVYAEKLLPRAEAPSAIPVEYAQRIIRILAGKLQPESEELSHTTSAILEPLS